MDTIIEMPAEPLNFLEEKMKEFDSALHEVQNQEAQGSTPPQTTKPLIQRVSPLLLDKMVDFQKCFEPRLVALGPLHHGNAKLQRAEQSKLKFAALFVNENETNRDDLFDKVKAEIGDLRKCYNPEDIAAYDDEMLAWMLFVDGCAVLCAVRYENQLPYKLLKILIGSAKDPEIWEKSITDFVAENLMTNIKQKSKHVADNKDYAHLLERLRDELLTGKEMKIDSSVIGRMLLSCGDNRKHRKTFRSVAT
ncbi:UPF0481 protein At3g47200-like [Gossypium arboreum]|uniref:UPF0481 protein At3g47200-like n=1 Tax=Gossypium arboreum TaxID=29729 RepID=UPI0022F1D97C|nr:UPF0481 protein At3g47200-like [Gossypium arboreum]